MKTIGIKLADGSFYPVLEDNTASEKSLTLTTAHNNQTKVMVDLYRSPTCSMEDAEYVDSLQIENLNAHPNGEADISFTISLDENNRLSARIIDQETGNQSNTTITLVSRTLEERLVTDEYDISDKKEDKKTKGLFASGGLLAAAEAIKARNDENKEIEPEVQSETEEPVIEEATVEIPAGTEIEQTLDEISVEPAESAAEETSDLSSADISIDEIKPADDIDSDDILDFNIPEENDTPAEHSEQNSAEDTFDDTQIPEIPEDMFAENKTEETSEDLSDFNLDDFNITESKTEKTDESTDITMEEASELSESGEDSFDVSTGEAALEMPVSSEDTFDSTFEETTGEMTNSGDDDLSETPGDFSFDDIPSGDDITSEQEDNFFDMEDETMKKTNDTPEHSGIDFDGLYDNRTVYPENGSSDDEIKKKTKTPVIICIICAIICLIATALILFIIPSKYNLLSSKTNVEKPAAEQSLPTPVPEQPKIEQPAENHTQELAAVYPPEPVPEAKEDEIVVIEKAEEVVPSQPPVAEIKPKNITYKIKWGDTLWDIADTYYKNPWRYKYIARYNGIKNPDYIISGTSIIIPAE